MGARVMWSLGHRADMSAWRCVTEVWNLLLRHGIRRGWDLRNWLVGAVNWRQSLGPAMKSRWKSERGVKKGYL